MKHLKVICFLIAAVLVLIGFVIKEDFISLIETGERNIPIDKKLEVIFLDVGQGDAILIKTPLNQKILIDGGPDNSVLNELGENLSFFDDEIDIMILTHPHSDHLVGLIEVLKRYNVKEIYYSGVSHTTNDFLAWLKEIKSRQIPLNIISQPITLNFGADVSLVFLYPDKDLSKQNVESLNNTSLMTKLVYNKTSFLFMGDAENEVENYLINQNLDLSADVLKVGHHGSSSSSSEKFLEKVKAKYAIISVGAKNDFGHPHSIILNRLSRLGYEILRTDLNGTIKFISDGEVLNYKNNYIKK